MLKTRQAFSRKGVKEHGIKNKFPESQVMNKQKAIPLLSSTKLFTKNIPIILKLFDHSSKTIVKYFNYIYFLAILLVITYYGFGFFSKIFLDGY